MRPYLGPLWTNSCQIWCARVFHHVLLKYGHENAEMQKRKFDDVTLRYSLPRNLTSSSTSHGVTSGKSPESGSTTSEPSWRVVVPAATSIVSEKRKSSWQDFISNSFFFHYLSFNLFFFFFFFFFWNDLELIVCICIHAFYSITYAIFCYTAVYAVWWHRWFDPDLVIYHWIVKKTRRIPYENAFRTGVRKLCNMVSGTLALTQRISTTMR